MSFDPPRPAYLLRFRHTEQYLEIQRLAERARLSVNEFILRLLEAHRADGKDQFVKMPLVVLLVLLAVPSMFGQNAVPTLNFLPPDPYPRLSHLTDGWTCIDLSASQQVCVPPAAPTKQVFPVGMGSETNGSPYVSDDGMAHPSVCGGQGASCVIEQEKRDTAKANDFIAHSAAPMADTFALVDRFQAPIEAGDGSFVLPKNYVCEVIGVHYVCSKQRIEEQADPEDVTTYSNDVGGYVEP